MDQTREREAITLLLGSEIGFGQTAGSALEGRGFRVTHAVGSERALALIRESPPQAVVLDVGMDSGSALALLAKIRATDPRLPVILLTEEGNTDVAMFGLELGAADVLRKPADVDRLGSRLRDIVASGSAAPRERNIADLMIPASEYRRVYEDDSVQRVIEVLTRSLFRAAPGKLTGQGHRTVLVCSRAGDFLGCIRLHDILDLLTPAPGRQSSAPSESGMFVARCKLFGGVTAGDMIGEQRFVDIGAPLIEAVELMAVDNLINIPVLKEGELVGMLTDRNLLLEMCNLATGGSPRWIRSGSSEKPPPGAVRTGPRRRSPRRLAFCP
jgi:DNA-binding response OmpR family regulator/CBS domain-containing protein